LIAHCRARFACSILCNSIFYAASRQLRSYVILGNVRCLLIVLPNQVAADLLLDPRMKESFIHVHARFSSGEGPGDSSPRRALNTSYSTYLTGSSIPKRDQARPEI